MTDAQGIRQVLFICTGNYYRSRFAEIVFNLGAERRGLPWRATSRGTDVHGLGKHNVGPISPAALRGLEARGIPPGTEVRFPIQLSEADFAAALIVGICDREHRPHVERDFASIAARVEYWGVEDLAVTPPEEALTALERHVSELLDRLSDASEWPRRGDGGFSPRRSRPEAPGQ